jgi:hypothetical protein
MNNNENCDNVAMHLCKTAREALHVPMVTGTRQFSIVFIKVNSRLW